jgi:hypothetical protein
LTGSKLLGICDDITPVQEINVIRHTHLFLCVPGLQGKEVLELYTDTHPTLLIDTSLRSFQRFRLVFDGFSVHPDLVVRLNVGETAFTIQAKGASDLLRGITQADNLLTQHFHSTTFMQYKSILMHAVVIKPHELGGSSAKTYGPDKDIWEFL